MKEYGDNPDPKKENYDRYLAEGIYWRREDKKRKSKYAEFYEEAKNLWLDLEFDITAKEMLLIRYFPKFREGGSQPICKWEPLQKSALFKEMMNYSKKQIA